MSRASLFLFLRVAWSNYGRWYLWGGDDPSGFDCSGFVLECLQSVGLVPSNHDMRARDLWSYFGDYVTPEAKRGALVFWRPEGGGEICHVEICLDASYSIGAKGGGSFVKTVEDAIEHNAFIKVRPIYGRPWGLELAGFVDLFGHENIVARTGETG